VGSLYVVVVMAGDNPGACCDLDNDIGGGLGRVNVRVDYGLVYASLSGATESTVVVGGLYSDPVRFNRSGEETGRGPTAPALFLPF
jgi:hypothetical protein